MSWNYRLCKKGFSYGIYEVYYNENDEVMYKDIHDRLEPNENN